MRHYQGMLSSRHRMSAPSITPHWLREHVQKPVQDHGQNKSAWGWVLGMKCHYGHGRNGNCSLLREEKTDTKLFLILTLLSIFLL